MLTLGAVAACTPVAGTVHEQAALHCAWRQTGELVCPATRSAEAKQAGVVPDRDSEPVRYSKAVPASRRHIWKRVALPTSVGRAIWVDLDEPLLDELLPGGAFTVAVLAHFDERPQGRAALLSRWRTHGDDRVFEIGMEWDGYPYFMVSPAGRGRGIGIVYADVPLTRRGDVLLAGAYEPGERLAIYANGVLLGDNRAVVPAKVHASSAPLRVGSRPGCGESCTWNGAVGDFFFFDRALGDLEQQTLAQEMGAEDAPTLAWTDPPQQVFDLDAFSETVREWYEELDTGQWPGAYRWKPSHTEPQLYSSADIAWIRWIIGDLDELSEAERLAWIDYLRSHQDPHDGSYPPQRLHDREHALAHVTAALNALGGEHRYPIRFIEPLLRPDAVVPWLESLDWYWQWGGSCTLWGVGMTALSSLSTPEAWDDALFAWLDRELDPELGAWRRGHPVRHPVDWIGGGFHIWTLYSTAGRPLPHPDRIIDLSLSLQRPDGDFDRKFGCGVLDGVWALAAAGEETNYRHRDVESALRRSLHGLLDLIERERFETGSHGMLSRIATLAILQNALPDDFRSTRPWRSPWTVPELFELRWEEQPGPEAPAGAVELECSPKPDGG